MSHMMYDVLGIGFGPANIALAICVQELYPELNIHFVEARKTTQWHPDMMLSGSDIQNNPLRDLVTPRNPRSQYTFINFLKETNRLFDHLNLGISFPLRIEYNQYIQWVAGHFNHQVTFGQRIAQVKPLMKGLQHIGYEAISDTGQRFKAKGLVLAPGRTPYVPDVLACSKSKRIIHHSKLLSTLNRLDTSNMSPKSIAIIGSSQSAVEITLDLRQRYPEAIIRNIIRNFGFRQKDVSPFTGEVYYPDYCQYYFESSSHAKEQLDLDLVYTNYSAADLDVLNQLYLEMYEDKIKGNNRHQLLRNINILKSQTSDTGQVILTFQEKYRKISSTATFDLVISATGFRNIGPENNQERYPKILSLIEAHLVKDDWGCIITGRNYELMTKDSINQNCPIVLNGLCEKSHGMGDAGSFSLLSLRSEQIIRHITDCFSLSTLKKVTN